MSDDLFGAVYTAMVEALSDIDMKRVHRIGEALTDPPAVVVGIPAMVWQGTASQPTGYTWPVAVVVPANDQAVVELLELVPRVAAALDKIAQVTVMRADPGVWSDGAVSLPCYEITCEVNL